MKKITGSKAKRIGAMMIQLESLAKKWDSVQQNLFEKLVVADTETWQLKKYIWINKKIKHAGLLPHSGSRDLKLVGGFDLSFFKHDANRAVSSLIICKLPDLEVLYEDTNSISLRHPYIPGYLAFREAEPCLVALERLKQGRPEFYPEVLLIDGNGILHPRRLGLASHIGILADLPTIGVAKNLYQMEDLVRNEEHKSKIRALQPGSYFHIGQQGSILGAALRTSETSRNPVYVSIGHKISLETALYCVKQCITEYRVPNPLREADLRSRFVVRQLLN